MDSKPSRIEIGLERVEDVEGLQEVFYRTWLATYPNAEHGITVEDIEDRYKNRLSDETIARRRERVLNPRSGETTLVARDGDTPIAICRIAKEADKNVQQAYYILPEYQRQGIGTRLWHEAMKYADSTKDTYVNVVDYNAPAIAFYTKLGFKDTGRRLRDERFRLKSGAIFTEMEMILPANP